LCIVVGWGTFCTAGTFRFFDSTGILFTLTRKLLLLSDAGFDLLFTKNTLDVEAFVILA
jgi:hypothetical protein